MKRFLLFTICLGFYLNGFSQNNEKANYNEIKKDAETFKEYLDPTFPDVNLHKDIQDPTIADYAKQHPHIPLKKNTGNPQSDQANWESNVNNWVAANPYFPQFLEYHKFNYLLTPEDDIIFYNTAKAEWIKRNPEKCKIKSADSKE